MKSRFIIQAVLILALSLFTAGCGGSDGGGGGGDSSSATASSSDTSTATASSSDTSTGTIVDAPVEGLKYVTATQSGYTDTDGKFKYKDGEEIEFFLGNLSLGKVRAVRFMTPYTLGGGSIGSATNKSANIAMILQNCDGDNSSGKINVANYKTFDFGNAIILSNGEADFKNNLSNKSVPTSITRTTALSNMDTYLGTLPANLTIPTITASQKSEFLNAINNARAQQQDCGIYGIKSATHALTWSYELYKAAYIYNYDMDNGDAWHHTGSNTEFDIVAKEDVLGHGSTMRERVEHYGYEWSTIGENIAKGQSSVSAVIAGWIDSDGHCKNLMSPDFTEVGMSLLVGTGTAYRTDGSTVPIAYNYWTQDFGTPKGSSAPMAPAPTPTGNENYTVTVYGSDGCGYTTRMRNDLTNANIPFTYKNVYGNNASSVQSEMWSKLRATTWYKNGDSVGFAVVDVSVNGTSHTFSRPSLNNDIKPLLGL